MHNEGAIMVEKLIPIYREEELYTLFYDEKNDKILKIPHTKRSLSAYYSLIFGLIVLSALLDPLYLPIQNPLFNLISLFISLVIVYFITKSFYRRYYEQDNIRDVWFDQEEMKVRAKKGQKQLNIELGAAIVFFLVSIFIFIIFIASSEVRALFVSMVCAAPVFILFYMKPLKRRKLLKKLRD